MKGRCREESVHNEREKSGGPTTQRAARRERNILRESWREL